MSNMERSLEEAISEVEREINVRKRCYDRWIADGKLSLVDARDRMERLLSAMKYLKEIVKDTVVPSSGDKTPPSQ